MNDLIEFEELEKALGIIPEEVTLPNGKHVTQTIWKSEHLVNLARMMHNESKKLSPVVDITGRKIPAWVAVSLVHECHPSYCRINSVDGFVDIYCGEQSGNGKGDNMNFNFLPAPKGWKHIEIEAIDPSIPYDPNVLEFVSPPEIKIGDLIILSGRAPNWLISAVAMEYHKNAGAIACLKGRKAIVVLTHTHRVQLGYRVEMDQPE